MSDDTRTRLLDAAESLFLDYGFDGSTLRMVTTLATANVAAVNYHFRGKDDLFQAMLARRLDPMNTARVRLLDEYERNSPDGPDDSAGSHHALSAEHILAAMFIPALHLARELRADASRERAGTRTNIGRNQHDFLRLLGRAYVDPSPVLRGFLAERYTDMIQRFKEAFARALPHLSRQELSWRLHFTLGALSYTLAGGDTWRLIASIQGDADDDARLLGRLAPFLIAGLQAPVPDLSRANPLLAPVKSIKSIKSIKPITRRRSLDIRTKAA